MKIIKFVLTCLVLFVTVSFAVSNKQPVSLTLWPFPFEAVVPLGFAVLAFSLLFFVFGGLWVWVRAIPVRAERFRQSRKIRELNEEIDDLRKNGSDA